MTEIVTSLSERVGMVKACAVLNMARSRLYRQRQPLLEPRPRPVQSHALTLAERETVRATLNSERFMDQSPRQVYAALMDEGRSLCHWRTMYRVLAVYQEVRERRLLRRHAVYQKPELLATAPQSGVVVGYHGAAGAEPVDVLPFICGFGHLQPLCGRLDDRRGRDQ